MNFAEGLKNIGFSEETLKGLSDIELKEQHEFRTRLKSKEKLSDAMAARIMEEMILTDAELRTLESFERLSSGNLPHADFNLSEFLATPSAQVLVPRVIVGAMREAAEPLYLAVKMLQKIRLKSGTSMVFPSSSVVRAHDVAEGQEIPAVSVDVQLHENTEVRVNKSGVRIQVSEEQIADSQWDVVAMNLREAGRAMVRLKEQKAFNQFRSHGRTVFDNYLADPLAHTTGLDQAGLMNDTFSAEDFLDLIIALMANDYAATDVLMHPLAWTVFAKNELTGSLQANPYQNYPVKGAPQTLALGPESIQGRLPFSFNVGLSSFVNLDQRARRFDVYAVDRTNIGVMLVRDDLRTEDFDDPSRGIKNVKMVERYGFGILNEGRAIAVAKNISMDKSFAQPTLIRNIGN